MVQRLCDQCRRDFARRDPIWREQPSYRRILLQGSGEGAARRGRDRSARRGRSAIHQGSARRLTPCSAEGSDAGLHSSCSGAEDAGIRAADRFAFVRDGFHFWALLFGPLWLAWHRLWLALIGWIVVVAAIDLAMARLGAGPSAIFRADVLLALLMGFEAASLQRWTLSRRNWRQLDIVVADDEESAERRFFDRWTAKQRGLSNDQGAVDRGGPPPTRDIPGQPSRSRRSRRARSSDCFRSREPRGERCHHRLRLRQSALGGEGVRARGAQHGRARQDRGDPRSRSGVSRRSHRAARRRRLRRLPPRARCARRHGRGDDGSGARQGAAVLRHLRRHAVDGDPRQGARHHRRLQLDRGRRREDHRRARKT